MTKADLREAVANAIYRERYKVGVDEFGKRLINGFDVDGDGINYYALAEAAIAAMQGKAERRS